MTKPDPDIEITEAKTWAAGIPGVMESLRQGTSLMGTARTVQTFTKINQTDGFDCPGCAWPEHEKRKHAEFCENGAKAVASEAMRRQVGPEFFATHSIAELYPKNDFWLGQQGRLSHPMYKPEDATHYEPIGWDQALDLIASRITSPEETVFYTSGRTSNEAAFAYQLLARTLGTNNLPDCSNMCHESSGVALIETIGVGKGSVTLNDIEDTDLLVIMGQNPGTNHPRMLSSLRAAKKKGARIVSINPLKEAGLMRFKDPQRASGVLGPGNLLSDEYLQVRLNGDLALFQGLGRLLLEYHDEHGTGIDEDFITQHGHGFAEYAAAIRQTPWEQILDATGLTMDELHTLRDEYLRADRVIVCWAMGLTQHQNSVPTIREIVNVHLLTGNIGKPGAGLCPVRGHSNVQGDRTMGIWEKPPAAWLDRLGAEFEFTPPYEPGYDVVESIEAMQQGKVSVFIGMGGNFIRATPDTYATEAAMAQVQLTVQISTKLNHSHLATGKEALILPCLGRTEKDLHNGEPQFVTVEDSMGIVHASRGQLKPGSAFLRSELDIVRELGARITPTAVPWREFTNERMRDHISRVVPGFEDFNERIKAPAGFVLPHPPRDSRTFPTETGKANFTVNELTVVAVPEGRLLLQTVRSHDQYNTTIYGMDDRYRGIKNGRRVVFIHPDDLARLGLTDGQIVSVISEWEDGERRIDDMRLVEYATARGCVAAYFPEANPLVPLKSTATGSNTPTSKSIVVRLEPAA